MDNEKKNKYAEYLPENRAKRENIGLSVKGARVMLIIFLIFLGGMFFYVRSNSKDSAVAIAESRYYNLNLTESINLDSIYSGEGVIWETDSKSINIENNVVTAVTPGKAYIIARIGNRQVTDLNITVLDNNRKIFIEDHDMEISAQGSGKVIVNQRVVDNNVTTNVDNVVDNSGNNYVNISNEYDDYDSDFYDEDEVNPEFGNASSTTPSNVVVDNSGLMYESSDTSVATVDGDGNIQPVSEGTVVITVTDTSGNEDHTYVTVREVEDISVDILEYYLELGDSVQIDYNVNEKVIKKSDVSFISNNTKVATVDSVGKVTARGVGEVFISAKVGNITKNIKIFVAARIISPTDISIKDNYIELFVGDSGKVVASVLPTNANSLYLSYRSSNTSIVSVDDKGNIKANNVGEASITVTTSNKISKSIRVKVKKRVIDATGISFNATNLKDGILRLDVGATTKLRYTITPATTTNKTVTFKYDKNYVSVDKDGNLKALKAGTTEVTVTTVNGRSAKLKVTISNLMKDDNKPPVKDEIKIDYVFINYLSKGLEVGKTFTLKAEVQPLDADQRVTFESSNASVATIDSNGKVTAKKEGTAYVYAISVKDKTKRAECKIVVKKKSIVTIKDGNIKGATGYAASNSGINLRNNPGDFTSQITVIGAAEPFKILEETVVRNKTWWKVNYNGKVGWVYTDYCMINLPDYIPSMSFDIKNAYSNNLTSAGYKLDIYGQQLYKAGKVYNKRIDRNEFIVPVVYSFAKKLYKAQQQALKEGYSIKVYDAYRPTDAAAKERASLERLYKSNSAVRAKIDPWGQAWFIADGVSFHSYGLAVDVTLTKKGSNSDLKMPTTYGVCDISAIKYYAKYINGVSTNRQTVVRNTWYASAMTKAAKDLDRIMLTGTGLSNLSSEWWHFQDMNSYSTVLQVAAGGLHFHPTKIVSDKS